MRRETGRAMDPSPMNGARGPEVRKLQIQRPSSKVKIQNPKKSQIPSPRYHYLGFEIWDFFSSLGFGLWSFQTDDVIRKSNERYWRVKTQNVKRRARELTFYVPLQTNAADCGVIQPQSALIE